MSQEQTQQKSKVFGLWGIGVGAFALLLVLFHFYAGPLSPTPTLEQSVAEKAVAIRDATVAALKGEEVKAAKSREMNLDRALEVGAAVLGGLAVILGVIAFARHESVRAAVGGPVLGAGAIAFQFAAVALGAIVFALILAAVLYKLDFDIFG